MQEWKNAYWIWTKDSQPNQWLCFRKTFTASQTDGARLLIAAENKYWVWINNTLAVVYGGLNRGPTPEDGYYEEHDVSSLLRHGENEIRILVWYWGNGGRNNTIGESGLMFACVLPDQTVVSDRSCEVAPHPAFQPDREPLPSYLYGGHNVIFDARCGEPKNFCPACEKGKYPDAPWNRLEKRRIPPFRVSKLRLLAARQTEESDGQRQYILQLPFAAHVFPYLKVTGATGGERIDIRTDRYEIPGGPGDEMNHYRAHRAEFIAKAGENEAELKGLLYGEQLIYTIPSHLEVLQLGYREAGYDCDRVGSFSCSDPFLNRLYEKCCRTLYICMMDNFMDCPDRERGQWIGDVSIQVPQVFYTLSSSSVLLVQKAMADFIRCRQGKLLKGNVPGTAPCELPSQSLHAIGTLGMYIKYYEFTGDSQYFELAMDPILDYLFLWDVSPDGVVHPREGDWQWYDHGPGVDAAVLETVFYYMALEGALFMLKTLGRPADSKLAGRRDAIRENFERLFYRGDSYRSGGEADDRANALAVLSGLAPKEHYEAIRHVLLHVKNSTPYMEGYVLEALAKMGHTDDMLRRMKERYGSLVENENSTLWEDFAILGTKNHAWSGAPLTLLLKYIAGIAPQAPGWESYTAKPDLCGLSWVEAKVPTVRGMIYLRADQNGVDCHMQ